MASRHTTLAAAVLAGGLALSPITPALAQTPTSTEQPSLYDAVSNGVESFFDSIQAWLDARYGDEAPAPAAPAPTTTDPVPQGESSPLPEETTDPGTVTDGTPPQDGEDGTDGQDGADGGTGGDGGSGGDGPPLTAPSSPAPSASADPTTDPTAQPSAEPTESASAEPTAEATAEPTAEATEQPSAEPTTEPTTPPEGDATTSWQDDLRNTVDGWIVKWTDREDGPGSETPTASPSPTESATDENTEGTPPVSTPDPTPSEGTGGTDGDTDPGTGGTDEGARVLFEGAGRSGEALFFTDHVDQTQPAGLMVHLHGDGAYEYKNPDSSVVAEYLEIAKATNSVLMVPLTPNTDETWWTDDTASDWLAAFVSDAQTQYPISTDNVWLSGFSGGAQALSQHFIPRHHDLFTGGGAVIVGGGTPASDAQLADVAAEDGQTFELHFVAGTDDRGNDAEGFDAYAAAQNGAAAYKEAGFAVSEFIELPGEDHNESADDGPRIMSEVR